MRKNRLSKAVITSLSAAMMLGGIQSGAVFASDEEPVKLTCFVNMSWYPVDSFTGKIPDAIKAATGVDLDVTIATDSNELGVMIASGELPDIIFTDAYLNELSTSEVCYSLDELTDDTGISFENSQNYDERAKIATTLSEDSKAYTLLNNYNSQEEWADLKIGAPGQACMYYRQDLLDAAGIAVPSNLDEFHETLKAVKEAYPDMTPLGIGGYWKFQILTNWFGILQENYDGNEYHYDPATDSYKEFLQYCNTLYREGLVSAEDYANENEEVGHQMAYNDGCVFYNWYLSNSNMTQLQSNAVSEDAVWGVLKPQGEAPVGSSRGWAGAFVSTNCTNTEAAAKLISYLNTEEGANLSMWGVEGEDYTLDEDGVPQFSDEYLAARSDSDKWYSEYNTMFYFGASAITEVYMNYSGMDEDLLAQFSAYGEGYKSYPEVGIAKPSATSDEGVIFSKLEDIKKKYEAKVIFTDTDDAFEAAYDEYMNALDKTGITEYDDYMTEKIAEVKEAFGF